MTCQMQNRPLGANTSDRPWKQLSGSSGLVSSVMGTLPPIAMIPASLTVACGRYCRRTAEPAPSAATSTSPVALLPSAKHAVTVPSSCCR
jgi:hypothetical protein